MDNGNIHIDCPWCESMNVYGDALCMSCKEMLPIFSDNNCEPKPTQPIRILPKVFKKKLLNDYFLFPLIATLISFILCVIFYSAIIIPLLALFATSIASIYGYFKYVKKKEVYEYKNAVLSKIISWRPMKIHTDEGVLKSDDKIVLNYSFHINHKEYFFLKETDRNNYLVPLFILSNPVIWILVDEDDIENHVFYPPVF